MASINLLPWRVKERERRNREFLVQMLIVALLSMLLAFLAWTYFDRELSSQHAANDVVKQANVALDRNLKEIAELEKTREEIVSRMKVIQQLQGTRPIPVHVFDNLVRTLPANLFLTEISLSGKTLTLKGRADNPNTVSDLLRNLDLTRWLENSAVSSIVNSATPIEPVKLAADGSPVAIVAASRAPEEDYISFVLTSQMADVNLAEKDASADSSAAAQPEGNK